MDIDLKDCTKVCEGVYKKSNTTYYILCSVSKVPCYCSGDRLQDLIKKYGSCEKVGGTYVSRDAKRLIKAKVPAKAIQKMGKEDLRVEAEDVHKDKLNKREERKARREAKEAIHEAIATVGLVYTPTPPTKADMDSPEMIAQLTKYSCLRPDLYLNWDKVCNRCRFHVHCACEAKNVLSEKKFKGME